MQNSLKLSYLTLHTQYRFWKIVTKVWIVYRIYVYLARQKKTN